MFFHTNDPRLGIACGWALAIPRHAFLVPASLRYPENDSRFPMRRRMSVGEYGYLLPTPRPEP